MTRRLSLIFVTVLLVCGLVVAAPAFGGRTAPTSRAVVKTAFNKILKKTILVDGKGRTLYMYTGDTKGVPTCEKTPDLECPFLWRPLTSTGKPIAGKGVNARLLAIVKGAGGKPQVSYNRHPLYLFSPDQKPGDVKGHTFYHVFYALSPKGTPIKSPGGDP